MEAKYILQYFVTYLLNVRSLATQIQRLKKKVFGAPVYVL